MDETSVITRIFDENREGGLLLCGFNPGWSVEDEKKEREGVNRHDGDTSFFSDKRFNEYRLRNTVVRWLELWGLPLQGEVNRAGPLERSIVQTNWMQVPSRHATDRNKRRECVEHPDGFLDTCERLHPALLLFFGKDLIEAFVSSELRVRVGKIFGDCTRGLEWEQVAVASTNNFRVGRAIYERAVVLSVPHPTGARGVSDAFVAGQEIVRADLKAWWRAHQAKLGIAP